ncbi:hypothetical protein M0R45_006852 [Rubus argutus]|uniref:Uncharacterized protein n=1 Tax=Rubus argutus TaxID=59490 RepID=A0AAW1YRQ8_RUBAR
MGQGEGEAGSAGVLNCCELCSRSFWRPRRRRQWTVQQGKRPWLGALGGSDGDDMAGPVWADRCAVL